MARKNVSQADYDSIKVHRRVKPNMTDENFVMKSLAKQTMDLISWKFVWVTKLTSWELHVKS